MKQEFCRFAYSFPIGIEFILGLLTGVLLMLTPLWFPSVRRGLQFVCGYAVTAFLCVQKWWRK